MWVVGPNDFGLVDLDSYLGWNGSVPHLVDSIFPAQSFGWMVDWMVVRMDLKCFEPDRTPGLDQLAPFPKIRFHLTGRGRGGD